jgi:hypothetical protein
MSSDWNSYRSDYQISGTTTISSMDRFLAYYQSYLMNISSINGDSNLTSHLITDVNNTQINNNYSNYSVTSVSIRIIAYVTIFSFSIIANMLAIITLAFNRRLHSFMSVFLINLTISDLLLTIFCIPFTLIGSILKNFIFGSFMCKIIPYFQGMSLFHSYNRSNLDLL